MIQLTEEEAMSYNDCPTLLDLSTGFYIFPVSTALPYKVRDHVKLPLYSRRGNM